MRYLVTGACGFIASRVADFLLDSGHDVIGIDNINDAYDTRLKQWRLDRLSQRPNFTFHHADISDRASVREIFASSRSVEAVINLGARAGVRQSIDNPWVYLSTNVEGTLNLLEECKAGGIRKFVLASTSSLYGAHNPLPYSEEADTNRPLSPYAASKKGAESLCYTYHHLFGLDVTILRYFTVYGPAGRPDMALFRFVQWISEGRKVVIYGDGTQSRDFTYVDDIARGTIAALRPAGYTVINLGSDHPINLNDALHAVEDLVGKKASLEFRPAHPADVPATWADITRAQQVLGWTPEVRFEDGLKALVSWYNENRSWAREIKTL
jgi:UDP-glucuronate 4-epimerase